MGATINRATGAELFSGPSPTDQEVRRRVLRDMAARGSALAARALEKLPAPTSPSSVPTRAPKRGAALLRPPAAAEREEDRTALLVRMAAAGSSMAADVLARRKKT